MTAPAIVGYRLPLAPWEFGGETVGLLTIEWGALVIRGVRLCRNTKGEFYLRGAFMRNSEDRLVIRSGPERDAILAEAKRLFSATHHPCIAETPLATAPQLEPSE